MVVLVDALHPSQQFFSHIGTLPVLNNCRYNVLLIDRHSTNKYAPGEAQTGHPQSEVEHSTILSHWV